METNCALEEPSVDAAPAVEMAPDVVVKEAPEEAGMRCYLHKDRQSETACTLCGNLICAECHVLLAQHHLCKKCLAEAERVPAPIVAAPQEPAPAPVSRRPSRFGHLAVPLIMGAIIGVAAASGHRKNGPIGESMFIGAIAGFVALFAGWLIGNIVIPNNVIREKKSVLGALGVSDYGEALLYTAIFSVLFFLFTAG